MDIKKLILTRLINYCYINDVGMTGYASVLQNIVHENDIQYIIAEKYYEEIRDEIIKEMINYERESETEECNQGNI